MRTIHQIVQQNIAHTAALVFDPLEMAAESEQMLPPMATRINFGRTMKSSATFTKTRSSFARIRSE
jgi:hypothetical protein